MLTKAEEIVRRDWGEPKHASAIQRCHDRIRQRLQEVMELAFEAGFHLDCVKHLVGHGNFGPWIKRRLKGVSEDTCEIYMQIYNNPLVAFGPPPCESINQFIHKYRQLKREVEDQKRAERNKKARENLADVEDAHQVYRADNRVFDWGTHIKSFDGRKHLDHIFTDPMWLTDDVEQYKWLARFARKWLKPGGYLAVQCAQTHIDKVLACFGYFKYLTTLAIVYKDGLGNYKPGFATHWRPVVLFSKGEPQRPTGKNIPDKVRVAVRPMIKTFDDLQQPVKPFRVWIENLTRPGELVGDPFMGTGTTAVACKVTARLCLGTEIDEGRFAAARWRIANEVKAKRKNPRDLL